MPSSLPNAQIGSDVGDGAASSHQVEHLAAEFLGVTRGHGHGSFSGRRDQHSSKLTRENPGHINPELEPSLMFWIQSIL
jgi:hypothetical protein